MSDITNLFGAGGIPAAGGVSGPQLAYGVWGGHQSELANASLFGHTGTGLSTMKTYADAGAQMKSVQQLQEMSQADTSAMTNFANTQKAQLGNQIAGLGTNLGGGDSGGFSSGGSFG